MSVRTSTRAGALAVASTLALGVVPLVAFAPAADAAPAPTKAAIATNHKSFVAGDKRLVVAARVSVANAKVKFYVKPAGGKPELLLSTTTDKDGYAGVKATAVYNATYSVRYAGSSTYAAASASTAIKVRVKMISKLGGGFKTSGSYRVYHASKKAVFAVGVAPKKKGTRVSFGLQVLSGKTWKTIDRRKYTLDKDSVTAGTFRGAAGRHYRVRASWAGDKLNGANHTAFRYAAFVK